METMGYLIFFLLYISSLETVRAKNIKQHDIHIANTSVIIQNNRKQIQQLIMSCSQKQLLCAQAKASYSHKIRTIFPILNQIFHLLTIYFFILKIIHTEDTNFLQIFFYNRSLHSNNIFYTREKYQLVNNRSFHSRANFFHFN